MAQCKGNILSHVSSWELSFTAMINLPEDLPQCNHWTMRLMLWGSVGFSFGGRLFWGDLVRKYFSYLSPPFFWDLVRKELRSIAIGWAALHCHCFDSPPRAFPIVRSSTQIWPGFKAALGGAENINDGFGWTSCCYHSTMAGKGYGSERGQNLMEILRRGLSLSLSLSTTWLRRKSADLQMAAYGKRKMVCT